MCSSIYIAFEVVNWAIMLCGGQGDIWPMRWTRVSKMRGCSTLCCGELSEAGGYSWWSGCVGEY